MKKQDEQTVAGVNTFYCNQYAWWEQDGSLILRDCWEGDLLGNMIGHKTILRPANVTIVEQATWRDAY